MKAEFNVHGAIENLNEKYSVKWRSSHYGYPYNAPFSVDGHIVVRLL